MITEFTMIQSGVSDSRRWERVRFRMQGCGRQEEERDRAAPWGGAMSTLVRKST